MQVDSARNLDFFKRFIRQNNCHHVVIWTHTTDDWYPFLFASKWLRMRLNDRSRVWLKSLIQTQRSWKSNKKESYRRKFCCHCSVYNLRHKSSDIRQQNLNSFENSCRLLLRTRRHLAVNTNLKSIINHLVNFWGSFIFLQRSRIWVCLFWETADYVLTIIILSLVIVFLTDVSGH